ncbi:MAG: M20/M25/M40 family metallo-hydrolase [Leifsonia flava]
MNRTQLKRGLAIATSLVLGGALAMTGVSPALASGSPGGDGWQKLNSLALRTAITADGLTRHLDALQSIAVRNGGNRAAGTPGHKASGAYVEKQLAKAGYKTSRQYFSYEQFVLEDSAFELTAPTPRVFTADEFSAMSYSASGDVSGPVVPVDLNLTGDRASTSGCESADFEGFVVGAIALLQRGTCPFSDKVANAATAGATAAIIFNQGNDVPGDDRTGVVSGTLGTASAIPAVGTSFAIGESIAATTGSAARVFVDGTLKNTKTFNVLADTSGRASETVVVGAHLDSVAEGPGINDNGTGSATLLETAIQLKRLHIQPQNRVRFAFWSGEEDGLQGSNYYVSQLSEKQIAATAVNLNFDMVGSPNAVRFVYDGDGDAFGAAGPEGSAEIEKVFTDYFAMKKLPTAPTEFDGRSDYFGFIENGIPAGGLFTGAEGIKTDAEAATFGGTAGAPYDPCYHQACDTTDNVDPVVFEQMADAAAHATLAFAKVKSWKHGHGWGKGHGNGLDKIAEHVQNRGSHAFR